MTPNAPTNKSETPPTFEETLRTLTRSRHPVIWMVTNEEGRALRYIEAVAKLPKTDGSIPAKPVYEWSNSRGLGTVVDGKFEAEDEEMNNVVTALKHILANAHHDKIGAIYVMRDRHKFLGEGNPAYRFLRDAVNELRSSHVTIVVTSPVANIPIELSKDIIVVDMPLPTQTELGVRLDATTATFPPSIPTLVNGEREKVLRAGAGLTEDEFESAVLESAVRSGKVDARLIVKAKEQIVRKAGIEFADATDGMSEVGGLENLKAWVKQKGQGFSKKAEDFGLRAPRGLFLTGPPGTGKSLTARATANFLGFPILKVSADAIFGKYVGDSEANVTRILKTAEAVAPCVLYMDEFEKLTRGMKGGEGDNGVGSRVLGIMLGWMEEHTAPVLVVATANDPLAVAPEMIGRFTEVFFVDTPSAQERYDIVNIHLKKTGRFMVNEIDGVSLSSVIDQMNGFSGREIARVVNEALYIAFEDGARELAASALMTVTMNTVPLSRSRKAEVQEMRRWASTNAKAASSSPAETERILVPRAEI